MLCQTCQKIPAHFFFETQDEFESTKYFELPFTLEAVRESALSGCDLCNLLGNNLAKDDTDIIDNEDTWSSCSSDEPLPDNENIRISASRHNLRLIAMEDGVMRRGALRYDTQVNSYSNFC
jgi:hypothetical protein